MKIVNKIISNQSKTLEVKILPGMNSLKSRPFKAYSGFYAAHFGHKGEAELRTTCDTTQT